MPILQLIYMSNLVDGNEMVIPAILESARRNNTKNGVTGMLLYGDGSFVQVLEGDPEQVRQTFECIRNDPRHTAFFKLDELQVKQREFDKWSMGYLKLSSLELKNLPELASLFQVKSGEVARRVAPGLAQAILKSFGNRVLL